MDILREFLVRGEPAADGDLGIFLKSQIEFSMNLITTNEFSPVLTWSPDINGVDGAAFAQFFPLLKNSTVPIGLKTRATGLSASYMGPALAAQNDRMTVNARKGTLVS